MSLRKSENNVVILAVIYSCFTFLPLGSTTLMMPVYICEIVFVDILLADVADEVTKQLHVHLHTYWYLLTYLVLSLTRLACVMAHRGGTTVFVTLDSPRYKKFRLQAAKLAKKTANVSVSDADIGISAADVGLVITMIYST